MTNHVATLVNVHTHSFQTYTLHEYYNYNIILTLCPVMDGHFLAMSTMLSKQVLLPQRVLKGVVVSEDRLVLWGTVELDKSGNSLRRDVQSAGKFWTAETQALGSLWWFPCTSPRFALECSKVAISRNTLRGEAYST